MAPHILLISVSIVVSVGTPSIRVAQPRVERDHPSSSPPFRSRSPPLRRPSPLNHSFTLLFVFPKDRRTLKSWDEWRECGCDLSLKF